MTTVDALKALYVKKGGALTDTYDSIAEGAKVRDYSAIPDMILAITQLEAVSLPAVNADDNGKVLKVADGAWGIGTDLTE